MSDEINEAVATKIMKFISHEDVWEDSVEKIVVCYKDEWSPVTNIAQAFEAEEMVPEDGRHTYGEILSMEVCGHGGSDFQECWDIAHATPLQRCTALLSWKEKDET